MVFFFFFSPECRLQRQGPIRGHFNFHSIFIACFGAHFIAPYKSLQMEIILHSILRSLSKNSMCEYRELAIGWPGHKRFVFMVFIKWNLFLNCKLICSHLSMFSNKSKCGHLTNVQHFSSDKFLLIDSIKCFIVTRNIQLQLVAAAYCSSLVRHFASTHHKHLVYTVYLCIDIMDLCLGSGLGALWVLFFVLVPFGRKSIVIFIIISEFLSFSRRLWWGDGNEGNVGIQNAIS